MCTIKVGGGGDISVILQSLHAHVLHFVGLGLCASLCPECPVKCVLLLLPTSNRTVCKVDLCHSMI